MAESCAERPILVFKLIMTDGRTLLSEEELEMGF